MKPVALTVLLFGAGQESSTFLWRILHEPDYYARHIEGDLLVIGADTGDEHDHTYDNVYRFRKLCADKGVDFCWITPDMGFHSEAWKTLMTQYERNDTIGSAAYQQTCTDNLKVKVCDNFTEWYIRDKYGYQGSKKMPFHIFHEWRGMVRIILGFAIGEESRTANGNKFDGKWKKKCVDRYYALIIDGMDRQACINYNEANIPWRIYPSNCMRCFYQSLQEILWLFRHFQYKFNEWVDREDAKLAKCAAAGVDPKSNLGVYGKLKLREKLAKAQELYGHWTDEELDEYKYSHGHCIKSKY